MKTERLLRVGDIVRIKDTFEHTKYDQKAGDVGVVTEIRHDGASAYITFARTGPDEDSWGILYLEILS